MGFSLSCKGFGGTFLDSPEQTDQAELKEVVVLFSFCGAAEHTHTSTCTRTHTHICIYIYIYIYERGSSRVYFTPYFLPIYLIRYK